MKKTTVSLVIGVILGIILMFLFYKLALPALNRSAVKNSFQEVTAKLDPNGEIYAYFHTETMLQAVENFFLKLQKIAAASQSEDSEEAQKVFRVILKLFQDSGIREVSGIGVSSIALKPDLFHTKIVVHHYRDRGKGLIWQMHDASPHDLSQLRMLPADTVIANFGETKILALWEWIKKEAAALNIPELQQAIDSIEPTLLQNGVDIKKLLNSLGGTSGYLICLDKEKKFTIPVEPLTLQIPEPSLAIFITVKDSYLFDLLQSKIPWAQKVEEKGVKKLKFPEFRLPFPVEPVIVQKDNMLIIASNGSLLESMVGSTQNSARLTDSEEYKNLSAKLPRQGNGFQYLSPRIFQLIKETLKKVAQGSTATGNENAIAQQVFDLFPKEIAFCSISQNSAEGPVFTINHTMSSAYLMFLPATAAAGMVSAVAVPNLLEATSKGKLKATMGDMRSISVAIESYLVDNAKLPPGKSLAEMKDKLVPYYIKELPLKDAWGNDFLYARGRAADSYMLASSGRDGKFLGWEQQGFYQVTKPADSDNDIIIRDGKFVYGPEAK